MGSSENLNIFKDVGTRLLPESYLQKGLQAINSRRKKFQLLLSDRKWPKEGWDDLSIEMFLEELASMDSNNFLSKSGVGEREGIIYSGLVARRNYNLSHGTGRSGDLGGVQPKAVGSSLLGVLTNELLLDLLKSRISRDIADAFLSPVATGMSLTLVLLTLKRKNPAGKYVIWPRIDQKSCFKCITTAGLTPLIIDGVIENDEIRTNLPKIKEMIEQHGKEILCVLTTTSCFAPRGMDSIDEVGKLCAKSDTFHVVNNAYGLQSTKCRKAIRRTHTIGRLDVFVQSTDKNLMVPVGGAIIAGFDKELIQSIRQNYPGRASSSQCIDVFITLMSMGSEKYEQLLNKRENLYDCMKTGLTNFAKAHGEEVIQTPHNEISIGVTLNSLCGKNGQSTFSVTEFGSMLFSRNICGARVVPRDSKPEILQEIFKFEGWGAHCKDYPHSYFTAAVTIGMEEKDVEMFLKKLEECMQQIKKKYHINSSSEQSSTCTLPDSEKSAYNHLAI